MLGDRGFVEKEFLLLDNGLETLEVRVGLFTFPLFYPFPYEDYTFDVRASLLSIGLLK